MLNKFFIDVKRRHNKVVEACFVLSLLICIVVFLAFREKEISLQQYHAEVGTVWVEVVPITSQAEPDNPPDKQRKPDPPQKKVESSDPQKADDFSYDLQNITSDISYKITPTHLRKLAKIETHPANLDQMPPEPVGGWQALEDNLVYPERGRQAKIEGVVKVKVALNAYGNVLRAEISQSLGIDIFDRAALEAVKATAWKPARQGGAPVAVRIIIPVVFRLR
ncbi:MAG: energy transducer TonB [bacterium]